MNYIQKFFKKSNLNELNLINYNEFKEIYYKNIISSTINNLQKSYNEPFSTNINKKNIMSYSVDNKNKKKPRTIIITPIEKMKRILRHSEKKVKKELIDNYINKSHTSTINKYQFYNLIKKLDLGLSNKEIEDIIDNGGFFCDGFIDLFKFNKFIFNDDYNLDINKKHIEEKLSEIKDLIFKYYTSPLLVFELNIDFEYFKNFNLSIIFKRK